MKVNESLKPEALKAPLERFFGLAAGKIRNVARDWDPAKGSPVFTVQGRYTARGWTEWTQGFQFGCQILQFDATGEDAFWRMGMENTVKYMAGHVSHTGVHDHGFNNISTYGNLRRLVHEGRIPELEPQLNFFELALKVSGAVQASRWTTLHDGTGFIHSFNGPHSLFSDTIRSLRILAVAHQLGHALMGENDRRISLLERLLEHARNTVKYNVFFGEGRDSWDRPGRVAHEGIFNVTDGRYRCPSTQQGYSPFTTWTRGQAWVLLGAAEQLEFLTTLPAEALGGEKQRWETLELLTRTARVIAEYWLEHSFADGIPFWDTGAPGVREAEDYQERASEPDNPWEPVDSSAAAIAAQGFFRLGRYLGEATPEGKKWTQTGLTLARKLLSEPYLSADPEHHGLLLHSVYHEPNGWDYVPEGKAVPQGESSMWGDYHLMELAVYLKRAIEGGKYLTFFD